MKTFFLTITGILFGCLSLQAQNTSIENYYDSVKTVTKTEPLVSAHAYDIRQISTVISYNNLFVRDYMLGFGVGAQYNKYLLQTRLNFDMRPYFKNVTFKENDTLYNQYKEKDYYVNVSLQKRFSIKKTFPNVQPYLQINGGLLWGNFKGWKKAPEQKFAVAMGVGAFIAFNNVFGIQAGYQYFKSLVENTPHRLCIQLQINFCE